MSQSSPSYPKPVFKQNDKLAKGLIWVVSAVIFLVIASLTRIKVDWHPGFDPHVFATINAIVNSSVAIVLVLAFRAAKSQRFEQHKKLMMAAIALSVIFLMSYIAHHLLAGDTKFGDLNHDGILSADEIAAAGGLRYFYYAILLTHIPLAAIILPFILFTAYRALSGNFTAHRKLARITWPLWLYVAITGVLVYLLISPYY